MNGNIAGICQRADNSIAMRIQSNFPPPFKATLLFGAVLLWASLPFVATAEPQSCIGLNPATGHWGAQLRPSAHLCPKHYAFFGAAKPQGPDSGRTAAALGHCCPLPAEDVLTERELFVAAECPDQTVATGVHLRSLPDGERAELRCTAINTARYQLGAASPGALWGFDLASAPYFWKEETVLKAADIPPALRSGVSRHDFREFNLNGCIGVPFGSLLVAKHGKRCKHFSFRELQFRGAQGDPPAGTPVTMFPQCRYVADPFSPKPICVE